MRATRLPIGARLFFLLSGMAALATALALGVQDRALSRDLERAAETRLDRAAEAAALLVARDLEGMSERYRAISGTPQFRATLEVRDQPTLTHYAQQLAEREGAALVAFLDRDGQSLAVAGESTLLAATGFRAGLFAHGGRAYAGTRVALETAGAPVGTLVAIEPIPDGVLASWSDLCGAQLSFAPAGERARSGLVRVVQALGDLELQIAAALEDEQKALAHSRLNLLGAGAAALALAFVASVFLARGLVRPILQIQAATVRIAEGDLEAHTHIERQDEIGDVARAFDLMLERLRAHVSELRRSQEHLENAQHLARIGSWRVDLQSGELTGSAQFRAILGLPDPGDPQKAIPHALVLDRIHPDDRRDLELGLRMSLTEGTGLHLDHRIVAQGAERILHTQGRVVGDGASAPRCLEGTIQDVTDRKRTEEQIRFLAYHDGLTGLGNRQLFAERLELALSRARRNGSKLGVVFLDLDHFKRINDTLGHSAGDHLLQGVADRLVGIVRDSDIIAHPGKDFDTAVSRLGGDEFTILVAEMDDPRNLAKVAQRILGVLSRPFDLQGHEVVVSGSIGIAAWPIDGEDVEALLRNADTAMYHAKDQGRNNYQFYTESMNAAALRRLTLEQKLRRALEENEFELHYQPKVSLADGGVTGFEALIRWRDPEAGLVMPSDFIPVAEETGLIAAVGDWVLRAACAQLAQWKREGLPLRPVSVNLSVHQFRGGRLAETVAEILRSTQVDARLLELEITESALMQNESSVVETLVSLREWGMRVAIDDFGTGYSSLSYLRRLPVDTLKIDRSFVQGIEHSAEDASLAAAIISMGKALGLHLVAEGVETQAQQNLLRAWGCGDLQGYVFSKPLPADAIRSLWQRAAPAAVR